MLKKIKRETDIITNVDLFNEIVLRVKESESWPDKLIEYASANNHDKVGLYNYEFDPHFVLKPGGSEGYYLDLGIYGNYTLTDSVNILNEGEDLDTEVFSDSAELVKYAEDIESLDECSIDTDDDTLYLMEVLEFTLIRNDGSVCLRDDGSVCIGAEILEDFNFRHMLKLADELPQEGLSVDGDTILKDQLDELFDEDYTGIYAEIIGIWKEARTDREKSLIKKMFETFTGISLKDYLEKCVITIAEEKHNER